MRNKYEKALRKIRIKERRLARQAMNDPDRKVRKRAFASISDEGSYAYIALEAPGPGLRAAAVEHVHDDQILGHLALHAGDEHVRRLAVNRIEDEGLLGYLATAAEDDQVRARADWNGAGYKDWAVVTMRDAELNEKVAPFLRLARVMACTICGVNPAGEQASAVLQPDPAEDNWRVSSVCDACAGGLRKREIIDAVRQSG